LNGAYLSTATKLKGCVQSESMARTKQLVSVSEIAGERISSDLATAVARNDLIVMARLLGLFEALAQNNPTGSVSLEKGVEQAHEVAEVVSTSR
jgi:hypothetical protein